VKQFQKQNYLQAITLANLSCPLNSGYPMPGANPASKFREGDFSNIWQSSLITSSLLQET